MDTHIQQLLRQTGFRVYENSCRQVRGTTICFARRNGSAFLATTQPEVLGELDEALLLDAETNLAGIPLTWPNYLALRTMLSLAPSTCDQPISFGAGDRLGMVSGAHLQALARYRVFPVIAQQSPRELVRTGRDFRDVMLSAVTGVLETGYAGTWGADADHIKHEQQILQAMEAGYSMYTVDVSDHLRDVTRLTQPEIVDKARTLSALSQSIVRDHLNLRIRTEQGEYYTLDAQQLALSAIAFEDALQEACRLYEILRTNLSAFDFELSIDESPRISTPEDHVFVVEYLRRSDANLTSLALRLPGEFQKGVDYAGDLAELGRALRLHAALCKELQGYRLSLHSGSDKFSIYHLFREATGGRFHVKTSGTSWLEAVELIARVHPVLFTDLYRLCLFSIEESTRGYSVSISAEQFPPLPPDDLSAFLAQPKVRQLFHISYGVLLEEAGSTIRDLLDAHEQEHYRLVTEHIEKHLQALTEAGGA